MALVSQPIIHDLGMQGEHLLVKIEFPVYEHPPNKGLQLAGSHSIILRIKASDLPKCSLSGEVPHIDIGLAIRERFERL